MSDPTFSRATGLAAKCDAEIKVRVPSEVKDDLARAARACGMNDAEFVRDLICLRLYGLDMMRKMHDERLARVAGVLSSSGGDRGPDDPRESGGRP